MSGCLVIVGTPIGNLHDISRRALKELKRADVIAAEDTRRTRALLSHFDIPSENRLVSCFRENEKPNAQRIAGWVAEGRRVALVSDSGMPVISDPGALVVKACVDAGLGVEIVPGPSAVSAAVAISGFEGSGFSFEGFIPRKGRARREALERLARAVHPTVAFESPMRLAGTLLDIRESVEAERQIVVVRELTKLHEEVWRSNVHEAAEHYATHNPKGEIVIVVGPREERNDPVEDDTIIRALQRTLAAGANVKEAAIQVAEDLGVQRRRAYNLVHDAELKTGPRQ